MHGAELECQCDDSAAPPPDRDAFRRFYLAEHGRALRVAARILGELASAEDAVHDAFVAAYRGFPALRESDRASSWFLRIVVRQCLRVQGRFTAARLELDAAAGEFRAPSPTGPDFELRDHLKQALARLPLRQRTSFWLKEIEGFTAVETASILGLSSATVRFHCFRARRALRRSLAAFDPRGEGEVDVER